MNTGNMNKVMATLIAVCLIVGGASLALAGDGATKQIKLEGWVVCKCCGGTNANAEGKACVLGCHKDGADLVFWSGGQAYQIADQKAAVAHVGSKVWAVGKLDADGKKLEVAEYIHADEGGQKKS